MKGNFIPIEKATSNEGRNLSLFVCVCIYACVYVCSFMLNSDVPMETSLLVNKSYMKGITSV